MTRPLPGILLVVIASLVACGGDGGTPDAALVIDAMEPSPDAPEICETCSPATQAGCTEGVRCSVQWESVDPPAGRVHCMPDGSRGLGESCTIDADLRIDDCERGLLCWEFSEGDPRCAELCTIVNGDSCGAGTCMLLTDVFECFSYMSGVCME